MGKYIKIALAALLAVCMLVGCGNSSDSKSGSYKSAIKAYEKLMNGDVSKLEDMAPEEFWEWLEEQYEDNDKEYDFEEIRDDAEDALEDFLDEKEDELGKNVRITFEITKEKQLDEDEVEEIAELLEKKYDIDEDDVTDAYELKIKLTAKGAEDDDSSRNEFVCVKISGKWYAIYVQESGSEYTSVSFVLEHM